MRKFHFGKIVRNKIPVSMEANGTIMEQRELSNDEKYHLLLEKVIEEAREAQVAPLEQRASELADLRAASRAVEAYSGITADEIDHLDVEKTSESGDFNPVVYLETVTVPDGDPWIEHFEDNPERYPEILE